MEIIPFITIKLFTLLVVLVAFGAPLLFFLLVTFEAVESKWWKITAGSLSFIFYMTYAHWVVPSKAEWAYVSTPNAASARYPVAASLHALCESFDEYRGIEKPEVPKPKVY